MAKFVSTPILNNPVWSFGWIIAQWFYDYVDGLRYPEHYVHYEQEGVELDYFSGGIRYYP